MPDDLKIDSVGTATDDALSKFTEFFLRNAFGPDRIRVSFWQITCRYEFDPRKGPDVIDVLSEALESRFRFGGGTLWRRFPFFTWRIASVREINAIPKLTVHPFARMIENADQSTAFGAQPLGYLRYLRLGRFEGRRIVQVHARVVGAHVKYVKSASVPERFLIQPHL